MPAAWGWMSRERLGFAGKEDFNPGRMGGMQGQLLHTPEGVRDLYGPECERKNRLEAAIHERLKLGGYQDIQTPGFEFFDIFRKERGTVAARDMYRFFDREGNTLVVRPDFTPSIARCVAKYYGGETHPLRLCYRGNTYINSSSYQGRLKETTQIGVELIHDDSVYADAELLALTVEALLAAGLTEFQLEVGNAAFFAGLMRHTELREEELAELRDLIENKYSFGVDAFVEEAGGRIPQGLRDVVCKLPEAFGTIDQLRGVKGMEGALAIPEVQAAFGRLAKLDRILALYGCSQYVAYDLGMLGKRNYYTGIIFRGYTYGMGEAVVSGGRYDHLVGQFGQDAPAVGMAITVDLLLLALARQGVPEPDARQKVLVVCPESLAEKAVCHLQRLHREGVCASWQAGAGEWEPEQLRRFLAQYGYTKLHSIREDGSVDAWFPPAEGGEGEL